MTTITGKNGQGMQQRQLKDLTLDEAADLLDLASTTMQGHLGPYTADAVHSAVQLLADTFYSVSLKLREFDKRGEHGNEDHQAGS